MNRLKALPTIVAVAVIAVGAVQLVHGAHSTGLSIDERIHVERLYGWLTHDWYVGEPFLVNGFPNPDNELSSPYVYGPAYSSLAHLANVELDNEPIGNVSFSVDAYTVRHLVVALLAALAAAAAAGAVRCLTGSWRSGLWAAAGLLAIPVWTGHGFFNPKDIPAGTGYTLVTAGLVLALAAGRPGHRRQAVIVALLAGGVFIGAGTRLALWVPIFASFLSYAVLRAGQRLRGGIEEGWRRDRAVLAGGAIGAAAIALVYPKAAETPKTLLIHSVSDSADYPLDSATLTAGQLLSSHPPWWYLPTWIGAGMPLLIGGLAILGTCLTVVVLSRMRERGPGSVWGERRLGLPLVLQQAVLIPLFAIATGATMYDGARQHLYVFPALAILAGFGGDRFWRWAQDERRARPWPAVAAVVLSAALVVPMTEQAILHPYNYAYVNPIAGIGGVNGRWETDYWSTSTRESLSRVPRGSRLRCSNGLTNPFGTQVKPEFHQCFTQPFGRERGRDAAESDTGDRRVWVLSWLRGGNQPPPWCEETDNVTRWLRGEDVVMGYVLRCDARRVSRNES